MRLQVFGCRVFRVLGSQWYAMIIPSQHTILPRGVSQELDKLPRLSANRTYLIAKNVHSATWPAGSQHDTLALQGRECSKFTPPTGNTHVQVYRVNERFNILCLAEC